MKVAVASVLREHRSRLRGAAQASAKQDDGEAEVIALLYGDASRRKRSFDTQPSHIRPAKAMPASPGPVFDPHGQEPQTTLSSEH
jgi:hypothetical protein